MTGTRPSDVETLSPNVTRGVIDGGDYQFEGFTFMGTHPSWCEPFQCQPAEPLLEDLAHFGTVGGMTLRLYDPKPVTGEGFYGEGQETLEVFMRQNCATMDVPPEVHLFQPNSDRELSLTLAEAVELTTVLQKAIEAALAEQS